MSVTGKVRNGWLEERRIYIKKVEKDTTGEHPLRQDILCSRLVRNRLQGHDTL